MKINEKYVKISVVIILILLLTVIAIISYIPNNTAKDSLAVKATSEVSARSNFITTNANKFYFNDKEFKFVGFNLFDAAATDFYKCGSWDRYTNSELDEAFKYIKENGGASVIRSWAFQSYTKSGTDWTGIDKLIRIAKDNGFKLILSLENGPGHCQLGNDGKAKWEYNDDSWYSEGYKNKYGSNEKTLYEYVDSIVEKYKDEATILAWELVNEPDTSRRTDGSTDCRAGTQSVLVDFAKDISDRIRSIDKNQPFSELSVKALKYIKYCALSFGGLYTIALPYIYYRAENDNAPGPLAIVIVLIFVSIVVVTFVAVLQKLMETGVSIKSENELTV